MDSKPITLWIQGIPHGFEIYYLETNSLVSLPSRKYRVCFLQASATSSGISALTYPVLMANQ